MDLHSGTNNSDSQVKWMFVLTAMMLANLSIFTVFQPSQRPGKKVIEIRTYIIKPGRRPEFHDLVQNHSIPLLKAHNIKVVGFGPSLDDQNSYFLIRSFESLSDREKKEYAFYTSEAWVNGPRTSILNLIESYTTVVTESDGLFCCYSTN